jgi:hypothetical protein
MIANRDDCRCNDCGYDVVSMARGEHGQMPHKCSVFFGYHAKSERFASERRLRPLIRRAIYLKANLNVKREMRQIR